MSTKCQVIHIYTYIYIHLIYIYEYFINVDAHMCIYIYTLQGTLCPCPTLGKRNIYKLCRLVGDMLLFRRDFVFNLHTVRWYMGADASKDIMDLFLDFEDVFGFSLAGDV